MTLGELHKGIAGIARLDHDGDHERAHAEEDALTMKVLEAVVRRDPDAYDLALAMLAALGRENAVRWFS